MFKDTLPSILDAYVCGDTIALKVSDWDLVHKYQVIIFRDPDGSQITNGNELPVAEGMKVDDIKKRIVSILIEELRKIWEEIEACKQVIENAKRTGKTECIPNALASMPKNVPHIADQYNVELWHENGQIGDVTK